MSGREWSNCLKKIRNENHLHRTELRRACRRTGPYARSARETAVLHEARHGAVAQQRSVLRACVQPGSALRDGTGRRINRVGKAIEERFAPRYYDEVGLGIDFTARDLQRECIAGGLPWEIGKAFDHSAALSPQFVPLAELGGDVQRLHFEMSLNDEVRQRGDTSQMIFGVNRVIAYVSQFVTLKIGDLIYTGTPVGVGPVRRRSYPASLEGRLLLDFDIK